MVSSWRRAKERGRNNEEFVKGASILLTYRNKKVDIYVMRAYDCSKIKDTKFKAVRKSLNMLHSRKKDE